MVLVSWFFQKIVKDLWNRQICAQLIRFIHGNNTTMHLIIHVSKFLHTRNLPIMMLIDIRLKTFDFDGLYCAFCVGDQSTVLQIRTPQGVIE